jgi:hypothetical protein
MRMPRRCPKKNATRLPISRASAGVIRRLPMPGSTLLGTANSAATTAAYPNCCQRRGGMVSGSLSMKPAKKTMGDDSRVKDATSLSEPPLNKPKPIRIVTASTTNRMPIRRCCVR